MSNSTPTTCAELLARMVEFDSVVPYHSGRADAERPLMEFLDLLATEWGFSTRQFPIPGAAANLLIEHHADSQAPWLLFDSHLDTVGTDGMTIPPFAPQLRRGRLYGRGACDTKGTGAAMLWALREYAAGAEQPNNVAILYSVGEEHVQLGAREFLTRQLPELAWRPAGVVVGEPTRMNVLAATGGFVRWKISTRGVAGHSSRPELGHNAIYDMARVIRALKDDYLPTADRAHPLVGRASASVNVVHGGRQVNVIPDYAEIIFDRRLVPGEEGDAEVGHVRALLAAVAELHPPMQVDHGDFESAPPMAPVDNGRLAKWTATTLRAMGIESEIQGALFTTNGNHFAAAGWPTVVVGPGDIAQAHTPDEWIALDELDRGATGYLALMRGNPT